MKLRPFGDTGMNVSEIGLGVLMIGMKRCVSFKNRLRRAVISSTPRPVTGEAGVRNYLARD